MFAVCLGCAYLSTALALSLSLSPAQRLWERVTPSSNNNVLVIPGVYDSLSARIMQQAHHEAVFLSGFGVSASLLGEPDAGLVTYSEMEMVARHLQAAVSRDTLLLVDGDTGYGSAANVRRAVRGMANVGAAAITIEDQAFPKRCNYMVGQQQGVSIVNRHESLQRIRAALEARKQALERDGRDILIIGRTDCRVALGLAEAMERCLLYQEAGCHIVYAENLQSPEEYQTLRQHVDATTPMMLAQAQTRGAIPLEMRNTSPHYLYTTQDIHDMGYQMALFGISSLQAAVQAIQRAALEMNQYGLVQQQPLASLDEIKQVVDYPDLIDFEGKFNCK